MQEVIKLNSIILQEIKGLRTDLSAMVKTHAQCISEEWITADQVMALLKISERHLRYLRKTCQLPYSKLNGLVYIRTADVENLLNQHYTAHPFAGLASTFKNEPDESK